jgi:glycosyltransferase involved in cell wall biosynthesis
MTHNPQSGAKILIINYEYPPIGGGGGVATKVFAEELAKLGHKVVVLTTHFKGLKRFEIMNSVEIYRISVLFRDSKAKASIASLISWPFLSIIKGIVLCKQTQFDVINSQFIVPSGVTGYLLSLLFKIPHIVYVHGADIYDPERIDMTPYGKGIFSSILKSLSKEILEHSRGIVCQSRDIASRVLGLFPHLKDKVEIIPLPFQKPENEITKIYSANNSFLKLVSIGRLVKRKGFIYLLEALAALPKYINFELNLIGEGPLKSELIVAAKNMDLLDKVKFRGHISEEEKYELLSNSDVYVLSSLHEGMGIVLQEAMYAGLPIISTNVGGQNDLLTDGENAVMVEPADKEALKAAILKIYENKAIREKLGQNNKAKIKQFYSEIIGKQFSNYIIAKIN